MVRACQCIQLMYTNGPTDFVLATCGYPFENEDSNFRIVSGYSDLGIEGSNVSIRCPPGLVLNGRSTLVCMENGEWEPDPREVECTDPTTAAGM